MKEFRLLPKLTDVGTQPCRGMERSDMETSSVPRDSRLAALDSLQAHLGLDARKSVEWQAAVREARR